MQLLEDDALWLTMSAAGLPTIEAAMGVQAAREGVARVLSAVGVT